MGDSCAGSVARSSHGTAASIRAIRGWQLPASPDLVRRHCFYAVRYLDRLPAQPRAAILFISSIDSFGPPFRLNRHVAWPDSEVLQNVLAQEDLPFGSDGERAHGAAFNGMFLV
jgi:hypothetical protein